MHKCRYKGKFEVMPTDELIFLAYFYLSKSFPTLLWNMELNHTMCVVSLLKAQVQVHWEHPQHFPWHACLQPVNKRKISACTEELMNEINETLPLRGW